MDSVLERGPDFMELLPEMHSPRMYEIDGVADGTATLADASEQVTDLLRTDVMMPGLDGFGRLEELHPDPRTGSLPAFPTSAWAEEGSRLEKLFDGVDDYLVEPFGAMEPPARMAAHLEMPRIRGEAARPGGEFEGRARQTQEQAAAILESITDGFVAFDRDWRFTHLNVEAERLNGLSREDVIGQVQWELFPSTRNTAFEFELRRAMAEQVAVQFEDYYKPWDSWYHVKAYPWEGGGVSVFFHDIRARKRSEEALRQAHDELEKRVRERTRELSRANARLVRQVAKRKRVEEARTQLRRRLVHAQEEEHRRIARELHDDLSQRLAILAIDAKMLEQSPGCPADIEARARGMREQLVSLAEGVHSLSRQLHPSILDELGIVDALRAECLSLGRRDGIAIRFLAYDVPTGLCREMALCVYRVAQEALRNIARHAKTRRATVRLFATDRRLVLCVRDKGVGFDAASRGKMGLGLESMKERARLVRARLIVKARRGGGTNVTLRVPLYRSRE